MVYVAYAPFRGKSNISHPHSPSGGHMRRAMTCLVLASAVLIPTVQAGAVAAAPHPKVSVAAYRGACHAAVDRYWPTQHRSWAHRIVTRESNGQPTAANRRSSARGCFQMLLRYSAPFYRAVGCNNYMWSNATCNVRAALVMFTRHGKSPWRTNY